jgi:hypothetical protein
MLPCGQPWPELSTGIGSRDSWQEARGTMSNDIEVSIRNAGDVAISTSRAM